MFVVWLPLAEGGTREMADKRSKLISDKRAAQYWDGERKLGWGYGKILKMPRKGTFAWDAVLLFQPDTEWKEKLPEPSSYYLGVKHRRKLDTSKLLRALKTLAKKVK